MNSQYQNVNYNQQYSPSQGQGMQSQQNIQSNTQYINQKNTQNKQYIPQQKIQTNNKFIPKTNQKQTQYTNNIPKSNVKANTQYMSQNNYINNNMQYYNQNNAKINMNYGPYTQNVQKTTTNKKQVNVKKTGNPVFMTQGQFIDQSGTLVQYSMIEGDNCIIGLENRSNMKIKMKLVLQGLVIGKEAKSFAAFYSSPKERKVFRTKILPNYSYEQISFEFQYV